MKPLYLLVLSLFLLVSTSLHADWGKNGHRATGEIASKYLSTEAKARIAQILDGVSLAMVSTFADEIKSDTLYRKYSPWHYVNYPFGGSYASSQKSNRGDLMAGIDACIAVLKDKSSTKKQQAFYLKLLVHFIGDLHQPMHVGIAKDLGGNRFQVQWFDEGTNLHRVWDEHLIDFYKMSYSELADNTPYVSPEELTRIQGGTHYDWMVESKELCQEVYAKTKVGANLKYDYAYLFMDKLRMQLFKGGVRLAVILNEVYA